MNTESGRRGHIHGRITDDNANPQAGVLITLHQPSPPRLLAETRTDLNGEYHFADLPAAKFLVRVDPGTPGSTERRAIIANDREAVSVDLSVTQRGLQQRYEVIQKRLLPPAETGNNNAIFGRVLDENGTALDGLSVRLRWTGAGPDTQFPTVKSGQNPFKPRGYFEFLHTPGVFMIDIVDAQVESSVADSLITADMPGRSRPIAYEVIFQRKAMTQTASRSSLSGRLPGVPPALTLTLNGSGSAPKLARVDTNGGFQFGELPAGVYQVSLEGVGVIASDIMLDGNNSHVIEFPLLGQVVGRIQPPTPAATVILTSERYSLRQEDDIDANGEYIFANLPADTYTLRLKNSDLPAQEIVCDGRQRVNGPTFERATETPSTATTPARLSHYLLLTTRDTAIATSQLTLAADFILRKTPIVGFSPGGCLRAQQVTIIGDADPTLLQTLRQKNIPVQQITGGLETLPSALEALP